MISEVFDLSSVLFWTNLYAKQLIRNWWLSYKQVLSTVVVSGCFQSGIYLSQEKRQLHGLDGWVLSVTILLPLMSLAHFVTEYSYFYSMFFWFYGNNSDDHSSFFPCISQYGKTWSLGCLSLDIEYLVGVQ